MSVNNRTFVSALFVLLAALAWAVIPSAAQEKKPNIIFIMGDDIGWFNIGAYHQGIMAGRTPNLDKIASEGFASPIIMPRQAARQAALTSSLASCPYARE